MSKFEPPEWDADGPRSFEEWTDREFDLSDPLQAWQYKRAKAAWRRWYARQLARARARARKARAEARRAATLARRLERERLRKLREEERRRLREERERLRRLRFLKRHQVRSLGGPGDLADEAEQRRLVHRSGSLARLVRGARSPGQACLQSHRAGQGMLKSTRATTLKKPKS